jgi:DNA-binding LacI/PurR family transcriptional regulator
MATKDVPLRSSRSTLQQQLRDLLLQDIREGLYAPGFRLPSVRELGKSYGVSRETAKRALNLLQAMGVVEILPGRGAYVLGKQSPEATGNIALVLDLGDAGAPTDDIEMVYGRLLQLIDSEIRGAGYHLVFSYINYSDPEAKEHFSSLLGKVDALFVLGLMNQSFSEELAALPMPVLSLLPNIDFEPLDQIGVDNKKSYLLASRFLLERGCRKLLYMDGPGDYYQARQRFEGCRAAAQSFGESGISVERVNSSGWSSEDARAAFLDLYATGKGYGVDGFLAVNDAMALGVLQASVRMGLRVPEDISIIGAKNSSFAASSDPPLTTIDCCFEDIAAAAARQLAARMEAPGGAASRTFFTGTIMERKSTRLLQGV